MAQGLSIQQTEYKVIDEMLSDNDCSKKIFF